jgi:hypothetical protein
MPNHVSHRIYFESDDYKAEDDALKKLEELMKTDDHPFNFDKLLPYPEHFAAADKAAHEAEKAGIPYSQRPKDGYNQGGYQWCIQNWGTKWGAYDAAWDCDCVTFNTAWSTAWPVWELLAKHFKDDNVEMVIEYADEDRGNNCGIITYKGGKQVSHVPHTAMRDPKLFARAVINEQRSNEYHRDWRKADARIKELEDELNKLRTGVAPEAVAIPAPSEDGCTKASHNNNKHKWMRFSNHWLCWWCGKAVID